MKDQVALSQWEYWRDKYGYEGAAETYYPHTFKSDPVLWLALTQLAHVKQQIDLRMNQLEQEHADDR